MSKQRVVVAMSGGVDSSMAAAILHAEGYQVIGVTLQIWPSNKEANEVERFGGCCGVEAIESARRVASKLGIPHYVMNFRDIFTQKVISDFCREYSLGHTPNPCIACNQYINFGAFLDRVLQMGADYLATGHYARIESSANGYRLLKGVDKSKDQSYFLYRLGQKELQHLIFPVGDRHKAGVRRLVAELGLPAAARRESQDICFIPNDDYRSFVDKHVPLRAGDIVDTEGRTLGQHRGLARYTVGQREGLGIASNKRRYVIKLDAASNRLVVGTQDQLLKNALPADDLHWVSGEAPKEPIEVTARVRYRSPEAAATVHLKDGVAEVQFHKPQKAIAPGQSIVFYQGDSVLGGGIITDSL